MRTLIIFAVALLATVAVYGQATETPTPTNTPTPTPTAVVRTIPAAGYSGYVTIGTASTTVIDPLAFEGLYIWNDGNETVYLNLAGGVAVMNSGYAVPQASGFFIDNRLVIDDSRKFRSVITGISSGGSDKLLISAW